MSIDWLVHVPIIKILGEDRLYLDAFCAKYGFEMADFDLECCENSGLIYFFNDSSSKHNAVGGYNIEGIKASLEED